MSKHDTITCLSNSLASAIAQVSGEANLVEEDVLRMIARSLVIMTGSCGRLDNDVSMFLRFLDEEKADFIKKREGKMN